jgi:hypothetical protein
MLLHAYPGQAACVLAGAAGRELREAALLSPVSIRFTLGAGTVKQIKHLAAAAAGPLALLIDEINATPPVMRGDTRPITYQLTANLAI